jgi:hypothetical protein
MVQAIGTVVTTYRNGQPRTHDNIDLNVVEGRRGLDQLSRLDNSVQGSVLRRIRLARQSPGPNTNLPATNIKSNVP